ncbi:MAG: glycoside hydrolase, partial [Ignavibacteriae bacterium]|nr:glycoside hydrolase [Ignavibacteriota bacterium]
MKKIVSIKLILVMLVILTNISFSQKLKLNESDYFEAQGINVLVFSNQYNGMFFDEKTAGIELIQHGIRTSTGGAVRLANTPEQWDLVPMMVDRKVDKEKNSINVVLKYEEFDFTSKINVIAKDNGVLISVYLDTPVPEKLEGRAGFNLEFLPSTYFEKTYMVDGNGGNFPRYPAGNTTIESIKNKITQFAGHTTFDDRGQGEFIVPEPLAKGKTIVLSPECPESFVTIK